MFFSYLFVNIFRVVRGGRPKHVKGKSKEARGSETVESEEDGGKSDKCKN